jgi:hypothetical protein
MNTVVIITLHYFRLSQKLLLLKGIIVIINVLIIVTRSHTEANAMIPSALSLFIGMLQPYSHLTNA